MGEAIRRFLLGKSCVFFPPWFLHSFLPIFMNLCTYWLINVCICVFPFRSVTCLCRINIYFRDIVFNKIYWLQGFVAVWRLYVVFLACDTVPSFMWWLRFRGELLSMSALSLSSVLYGSNRCFWKVCRPQRVCKLYHNLEDLAQINCFDSSFTIFVLGCIYSVF